MYYNERKEDTKEILKYHRAKDMINIMKYFPGISPVDKLAVVTSKEDYLKNKDILEGLTSIRNGNPTKELCMKSIPVKEINPDILEVMDEVKKENENGVVILFHLTVNPSERYERYAGMSVGVSLGNKIYIDAVGKGFDGREVLKGISCHERYSIPWSDIRRVSIGNFKDYRTYLTNDEEYKISRDERVKFLLNCGIDKEIVESNVPKEYTEIPDFIWLDVIKNIIKVLEKEEDILRYDGFLEFNLSGHTEGKRFRPWQMVDDKRM
ncbi:MAG: hypothetical protein IKE63_06945 [Bacilli bacterium]|nr:hypothetical protein [Bacilli bacterium]